MKELFSRRYRDKSGDPEVYIYNNFSQEFRNQCFHIVRDFINEMQKTTSVNVAEFICKKFAREKGLKYIEGYRYINDLDAISKYFDRSSNEDFFDFVDFIFTNFVGSQKLIDGYRHYSNEPFVCAADELNLRFKQHSLGYEFTNGEIIPKTNEVIHQQIIKPALKVLTDERFRGAEEEYLLAFEHFKTGNNKDAILNAGKAFESTIKTICKELEYKYEYTSSAKKLVETLKSNGFYPSYLDSCLNNLCGLLVEGAPVVRNKESGHGQGASVKSTADEYVEYVLNTVASNIVFLYRLFESKGSVK